LQRNPNELLPGTNASPQVANMLTNPGVAGQFPSTNLFAVSNQFGGTNFFTLDSTNRPMSAADQALLTRVRTSILPLINNSQTTAPIQFMVRNGIVTPMGNLASIDEKKRVLSALWLMPGVMGVQDRLSFPGMAAGMLPTGTLEAGATGAGVDTVGGTLPSGAINAAGDAQSAPSAPTSVAPTDTTTGTQPTVGGTANPANTTPVMQDRAFTALDQNLLTRLRHIVPAAINVPEASLPVHFVVREGVVNLNGFVTSAAQHQQVINAVRSMPGVASVVDQLKVSDTTAQQNTLGAGALPPTSSPGSPARVFPNQATNTPSGGLQP